MTKEDLYKSVDRIREHWGIKPKHYPLDSVSICNRVRSLQVNYLPFNTSGLQGVIWLEKDNDCYIILNSGRSQVENNFYCAHELAHFILHRNFPAQSFQCYDKIRDKQIAFLEWQANEWAAEFLVPYRLFIPEFIRRLDLIPEQYYHPMIPKSNYESQYLSCLPQIRWELAILFGVSERVIYNRIESLKYEILQYEYGISLSEIKVRSITQQLKNGLRIKSKNEPQKPFVLNKKALNIY